MWGPNGTRVVASESMWREPLKWDRAAAQAGERRRVFCASLADWLEDWRGPILDSHGNRVYVTAPHPWEYYSPDQAPPPGRRPLTYTDVRGRLLTLIAVTPNLDWLLLTKRPEGFSDRLHEVVRDTLEGGDVIASDWLDGNPPGNVWAMTTVENQEYADVRIPQLLDIPARVHGLSVEPMLGPVDLSEWLFPYGQTGDSHVHDSLTDLPGDSLQWVVCGFESGHSARPGHPDWARSLRDQCREAGVPYFFKQWGEWRPDGQGTPYLSDVVGGRNSHQSRAMFSDGTHLPDLTGRGTNGDGAVVVRKLGNAHSGHLLDGVEWHEFPEPAPTP